nr:hypothetical protein [Tanacetum cinerariifolium]
MKTMLMLKLMLEVIEFGDSYKAPQEETGKGPASESFAKKKGRTVVITTKDMQKRRNDVKARTTLLLALPDEHQLRFSKLQAIMSHLEFMDVEIEQDDLNQKFLTSLAPEWLMYTIVWRNRDDLDTMSLDDVYNHLKVGKGEVHTASVPTASSQVSTASTNVAATSISHDTVCAYIASQSNGSQIKYEDITQIDEDDIKEIDIKWNMALLSMRADRWNASIPTKWAIFLRSAKHLEVKTDSYMANEEENHALEADDEARTEFALIAKSSSSSENEVYHWLRLDLLNSKHKKLSSVKKLKALKEILRPTPCIDLSKSYTSDLQNSNFFVSKHGESSSSIMSKPMIKFVKAADCPGVIKTNKTETARKSPINNAEIQVNTARPKEVINVVRMNRVNNVKASANVKESLKKNQAEVTEGSSKRARQELNQESSKKQKLAEQEQATVDDDDTTKLKRCLKIVPEDDDDVAIEAKPLSSKSSTIVDYKIYREGKKSYFKIIRADRLTKLSNFWNNVQELQQRRLRSFKEYCQGKRFLVIVYVEVLIRGFSTTNETLGFQSEVSSASVETLSADALPTIAPIEAPHSRNHVKSPQTQDTSIENASSDRRSKKDNINADFNATLEPVADTLPTITPIEAPHSRNHVKSPQIQDTSTEDASSDRRSKKGSKGVTRGRNVAMNKYNGFDDDDRDKIGKELLHLAPSPYYMSYPYDEVPTPTPLLSAEGLTPKKLSDCMNEAQLPAQVEHLSAELAKPKETNHALEKENHSRCKKYKKYKARRDSLVLEKEKLKNKLVEILTASKQDKESFAQGKS